MINRIKAFFTEHPTIKGFIIGFCLCFVIFWLENDAKYKIGQESEQVTATVDIYPYINSKSLNYDGDFEIKRYLEGKYNHLNLTNFTEEVFTSMLDNEIICKISNKFIIKDGKYYHVCDETALFKPTKKDIIIKTE